MRKFEYMLENVHILHDTDLTPMTQRLNELGQQGWEAILIKEARAVVSSDGRHFIGIPTMFKRVCEPQEQLPTCNENYVPSEEPPPVKRGPGRPRKNPLPESTQENTPAEIEPANLAAVES